MCVHAKLQLVAEFRCRLHPVCIVFVAALSHCCFPLQMPAPALLREVNIEEEEEEGEGSQKLFDAFDCFLNFSFCLNPCLVFILTSRRAEKDQWPQHLGLRPALKAFRSSPHTTWAPGDKTADCLC